MKIILWQVDSFLIGKDKPEKGKIERGGCLEPLSSNLFSGSFSNFPSLSNLTFHLFAAFFENV